MNANLREIVFFLLITCLLSSTVGCGVSMLLQVIIVSKSMCFRQLWDNYTCMFIFYLHCTFFKFCLTVANSTFISSSYWYSRLCIRIILFVDLIWSYESQMHLTRSQEDSMCSVWFTAWVLAEAICLGFMFNCWWYVLWKVFFLPCTVTL